MRVFVRLGGGLTLACLLGAYVLAGWSLPVGILLAVAAVLLLCFRRKSFCLIGLALGLIWFGLYTQFALGPAKNLDGQTCTVTIRAVDYGYDTGYGTAVEGKLKQNGRQIGCKLYLNNGLDIVPGDSIQGTFRLSYTGPDGLKESSYYAGTGISLLAYQKGELTITPSDGGLQYLPQRLRQTVLGKIDSLFSGEIAAFAKALLMGETKDLSYSTQSALSTSGIAHVVAVSGLHVSILFAVLFFLSRKQRLITAIFGYALLFLAAAVTGFSASIVRACLMNGLMLLGMAVGRDYDPLTALFFALTVMLGINPMAITSVGLQLSAASVLGILLFAPTIANWISTRNFWAEAPMDSLLHALRDRLSSAVGVTLGATIATVPFTALYFGTVSLVGWLTNLLVLWVVSLLFVGILACVLLSFLCMPGILVIMLTWGIRYVLGVAGLLGGWPLAAVYTESPYIVIWLVFAYLMLAVFLLMKRKRRFQLCIWVTLTLVAAVALSWIEPRLQDCRFTALDVGQGQCIILQSDGRTYMVDCGGSDDEDTADKAVHHLYSMGIFQLDGLVLSHSDRDHVGGAQYLLSRIPVSTVYLPEGYSLNAEAKTCVVDKTLQLSWQDTAMDIIFLGNQQTTNESSLCVLFRTEKCDILITGDQDDLGEKALVRQHDIDRLDVLVVGHHGSDKSTGTYLLEQTHPSVAVVSVGADNHYGHPADTVLERLGQYGCHILRTDEIGNIILGR